jgi:ribosome-associated translation inhibitor RaiA
MHTRITARRFDVNDGLRAHIDSSMGKLDRYFDGIHDAHVILDGHDARDGQAIFRRASTTRTTGAAVCMM